MIEPGKDLIFDRNELLYNKCVGVTEITDTEIRIGIIERVETDEAFLRRLYERNKSLEHLAQFPFKIENNGD